MFGSLQGSLFGAAEVDFDAGFATLQREKLAGGAWVDYATGWLAGDERLFAHIATAAPWQSPRVKMYDRVVQTPRLTARLDVSLDPVLPRIVEALSARYGVRLDRISAGFYRDGNDSVAWHGDRVARDLDEAIVATVSLAGPRRFLLRPKGGGTSIGYTLGHGDLIVMGGSCQRTWDHTIPKVRSAPPRIALMFRHAYPDPAVG